MKSALKAIVQQFNLTMVCPCPYNPILTTVVVDFSAYITTQILSPTQSVFFKDILPEQRPVIDQILRDHNISPVEEIGTATSIRYCKMFCCNPNICLDPLVRLSIACPALPLCGLAVTEAERRMPGLGDFPFLQSLRIADCNLLCIVLDWTVAVRKLLTKLQMDNDKIMLRMTGCPNGCGESLVSQYSLSLSTIFPYYTIGCSVRSTTLHG